MTSHTTPTIINRRVWKSTELVKKKIIVKTATMSTDETLTFAEVTTLGSAHVFLTSSGAEYTCSVATNVVTLTETAITDAAVTVIGVEA